MFQQGDVLIKQSKVPKGAKKKGNKTVALGEATGHHHTFTEGDVTLYEHEGTIFAKVTSEEATLTHQEHNPVTIPKGDYVFPIVREYNFLEMEERRVVD